jgi:uroporphyrinogen-III decarboxylase
MEAESIGANINFYHDHIPDVDRSDFVIKTVTDLDKIKFNGLDSGRYPFLIEFWTAFVNYTGMPSFPEVCAPWSLATNIYGMENLLVACLTDPGFVHELMNRIVYDLQVPLIAELKQLFPGAANFTLPDAWCSPPMLTPAIIDEFVEPYLIKLDQAIGPELPFSHAAVWLPEKPGVDFDAYFGLIKRYNGTVNCFDPELFTLGPRYYRELADKLQMPLNLLVSPGFILTATAEQAAERAKLFALVGKDGITPCSTALACIPPFTPIENIKSYIAAVRTFGAPDADADTPFELPESDAGFNAFIKQKMENNVEGYSFSWLSHSGLEL